MTDSPALNVYYDEFTPEVEAALRTLRDAGFAVAAFSPSELQGVDTDHVEDVMVERGVCAIETLRDPEKGL